MLRELKKKMPGLYAYYRHLRSRALIKRIAAQKKQPEEAYPQRMAELYKQKIGHDLDWENLNTYTEKMQWEKLYNKDPRKTTLSDKYLVREWVAKEIGEEYLIGLLGVWDSFDEIDFDTLPDRFVLKTNHGSGTNLIVRDKSKLNYRRARRMFNDWMDIDFAFRNGYQMHYSAIQPKIIAEEYMETEDGELQDYKFLCFDGKPHFCWVDKGRYSKHTRNVYDLSWNLQPWNQAALGLYEKPIPKPKNFEKMIQLAEKLSAGFAHVRVDFYNVDGKIYFGEMTFTNGSGFDRIIPSEYDRMLGDLWTLPR